MCYRLLLFLAMFSGIPTVVHAQPVYHWATSQECLAATGAPFYYPTIINDRKVTADEMVLGSSVGACVDMDLPESVGGRGWVRIGPDRRFVYNRKTGMVLRLEECQNKVYAVMPFDSSAQDSTARPGPIEASLLHQLMEQLEVKHSFAEPLMVQFAGETSAPVPALPQQKKSWMARNRGWLIPVVAAAVGGGVVCAVKCGGRTVTQTQEVIINY